METKKNDQMKTENVQIKTENVQMKTENQNVLVLKVRAIPFKAFHYRGMNDLKELIGFVGMSPQITVETNGNMVLNFKKIEVKENAIIWVDSFCNIVGQATPTTIVDRFEIIASRKFAVEDIAKPHIKERKTREAKK